MRNLVWLFLLATPGWSEPARVTVSTEKACYLLGENVLLHFRVENLGKESIFVDTGGDYRGAPRALRYRVEAFDPLGRLLADPHPKPMCFGGLSCNLEVKPGQSFQASLALAHYRRIPRAGKYRIRVGHDLGWKEAPSAWTELEFRQPTARQAEELVQRMQHTAPRVSVRIGQLTPDFQDFWTLSYPIYREPLTRLANREALIGLGQISGPAALASLLQLAQKPPLRLAAARQLHARFPSRWDHHYDGPTRALARRLLQGNLEEISCGANLLERVGNKDDLPLLLTTTERHLAAVSTYPRPAGPAYDLERALLALPALVGPPNTSAARLRALQGKVVAPQLATQCLTDRAARVRELAVLALKQPPYPATLNDLLNDPDPGVQVAACEKLAGSPAVLELLRTTEDEWVLRAAAQAAGTGQRFACSQILSQRLREKERWQVVFLALAETLMTEVHGSSSTGDPEQSQLDILVGNWERFLLLHQQEIEQGKKFPRIPEDLIPPNFQLHW